MFFFLRSSFARSFVRRSCMFIPCEAQNVIRMGYRRDIFINGNRIESPLQVKCVFAQSVRSQHYNIIIGLKNRHLNKLRSMGDVGVESEQHKYKYLKIGKKFTASLAFRFYEHNIRASLHPANAKYLKSHKILLRREKNGTKSISLIPSLQMSDCNEVKARWYLIM